MNDRDGNRAANPVDLANRLALRPKEAAATLGVSEGTFRNLLPRIPHLRVDRAVLIPVEALRQWLAEEAKAEGDRADRAAAEILEAMGKPSNRS